MHFEGGERGFPCLFEVPISSEFASCCVVVSADLSISHLSHGLISSPFAILLQFFFQLAFTRPNDPL